MQESVSFDLGSYKLSEKLVRKITDRKITGKDGKIYPGASGNEICTVLYFSMICDSSGFIPAFPISSLSSVIGCSARDCYTLFESLEKKGFIRVYTSSKNGLRDITLLHNDYRNYNRAMYKNNRYLNTNHGFLNPSSGDYQTFRNLSLYAKRLLIALLFSYNKKHGYRAKLSYLAKKIGIETSSLISDYLKELEPFLGLQGVEHFLRIQKEGRRADAVLTLTGKNTLFQNETGLTDDQPSYLRYRIDQLLRKYDMVCDRVNEYYPTQRRRLSDKERRELVAQTSNYITSFCTEAKFRAEEYKEVLKEFARFLLLQESYSKEKLYSFCSILNERITYSGPLPDDFAVGI